MEVGRHITWLLSQPVTYLWKVQMGWEAEGRNSVSGANHPPYSGMGSGCGW